MRFIIRYKGPDPVDRMEIPVTSPTSWHELARLDGWDYSGLLSFINEEIPSVPWFRPDGEPDPKWKLSLGDNLDVAANLVSAVSGVDSSGTRSATRNAVRDNARNTARNIIRSADRNAVWDAARLVARSATWSAIRDAARSAVWGATWNTAWGISKFAAENAAWDADLYTSLFILNNLQFDNKHRRHIINRWKVWQKGYGLFGDISGTLYVYGTKPKTSAVSPRESEQEG